MTRTLIRFRLSLAILMLAAYAVYAATPAQPSDADRAAIFKAAGFKTKGGQYIRCEEDPPTMSHMAGSIEMADLNKDGKPEAWVRESSTFCYGNTAEYFVLLSKTASGAWVKLLEGAGIALEHAEKRNGWPKIEVGGPGNGPFPVFYFDEKKYVEGR